MGAGVVKLVWEEEVRKVGFSEDLRGKMKTSHTMLKMKKMMLTTTLMRELMLKRFLKMLVRERRNKFHRSGIMDRRLKGYVFVTYVLLS